ncbi:MAG: GntR family transcriptional regulator [Hyphomicrobiales bacterium]|nr:GntR family transcriptional regulator [Hyphomicrobiales bacterium]MDE2115151.1 GntR family transcriptional regulator [Hyphomicrobiales bacterium]
MLASDARLPLYQRLRNDLAERISRKEWRVGQSIPPEGQLAQDWGVAIGTVRKAVDLLAADGVLERLQGRGTFVRSPRFDASMFRFFRFQTIEGARTVPVSHILERRVEPASSAIAAALQLREGAQVIYLSRLRLIQGVPVLCEDIWLPKQKFLPLIHLDVASFGDLLYPLYETHCGAVVARARETLTVETSDAAVAAHLQLQPGAPLIRIERLAMDIAQNPLEWRTSRGPADKFRYHAEIS